MSSFPFETVLLSNDDGIDAPGLAVLADIAAQVGREVWIVAPACDQSGVSHALSLHDPLRVSRKDERVFAITGTPADCVAMGVRRLLPRKPDLILSGVNRGGNLGVETMFSGTVGGAMAGLLLGVPSIALSQVFSNRDAVQWETARVHGPTVVRRFAHGDWSADSCLNVNFPDVSADRAGPVTLTEQGAGLLNDMQIVSGVDPRNMDFHWLKLCRQPRNEAPNSETMVVRNGGISVTPLQFERTNRAALSRLAAMTG